METEEGYFVDIIEINHHGKIYNIEKKYQYARTWDDLVTIYEHKGQEIASVEECPGAEKFGMKPYTLTRKYMEDEYFEEWQQKDFDTIEEAENQIKEHFIDYYITMLEKAHNFCSNLDKLKIEIESMAHLYKNILPSSFDKLQKSVIETKEEVIRRMGSLSNL